MNNDVYFAADEAISLIAKCESKLQEWGAMSGTSGFMSSVVKAQWRNNAAYYSAMLEPQAWDSSFTFEGENSEFIKTFIPKARVLIRQFVSLATKQRYSFDCVTDVNDADPLRTSRIGNSLVKAEVERHKIDFLAEKIVEAVCIEGLCVVSNTWDTGKGYIYGRMDDKNMLYSGGCRLELYMLNDIVFDWSKKTPEDLDWIILRKKFNKWDLIAQFPELEEEIKALPPANIERMAIPGLHFEDHTQDTDSVYIREFYHKPTPALPFGRMVVWGNNDTILVDSQNPYECLPCTFFIFQQIKNTLLGYPMMSNLIGAQEIFTGEVSTVTTNHSSFGVQSVLVPQGSNISPQQVTNGMVFIEYVPQNADGGGKPEPMQLTSTPPEVFNFMNMVSSYLDELSLINATLRGAPPANVTSGAMAATLSANALEFIYSDTKGLIIGLEALMTQSIKNYQKFATLEQLIDVLGEGNVSSVEEFKADDIKTIKKVKIRQGNPLLNTIAGRLQLGEAILPLLEQGKTDAISRYLGLLEGAPIDSLFDSELSEDMAVTQELEALQRGENISPLISDNHPMFIRAYQKLLYNPNVRQNGVLVQTILDLIMERLELEARCPSDLKAILRRLPMPQNPSIPSPTPPQPEGTPSQETMPPSETQYSNQAMPAKPEVI